jgi:Heterokaryon incompatibility protein (HET)
VTLTHRGGACEHFSMERKNLHDRLEGIAIKTLPDTFRDAVVTTSRLRFQYLWIDSLCIIQDDPENWDIECARMSSIYRGSVLTIAAADAENSWAGFLHGREFMQRQDLKPCQLQYRNFHGAPQGGVTIWYPGHPSEDKRRTEHQQPQQVLKQQPNSVLQHRGGLFRSQYCLAASSILATTRCTSIAWTLNTTKCSVTFLHTRSNQPQL